MPKIVELRQDRNLIRSNFDGYKLSLDAVPLIRQELNKIPYKATQNDAQYSLLHTELFSMQNLLYADPWCRTTTYFVSTQGEVVCSNYDESIGRPQAPQVVYRMKSEKPRVNGDYNYSMRFISEKYCVVCNGKRQIFLLETGDRRKLLEWKQVSSAEICNAEESCNFTIQDCRLDIIQEQKQISMILGNIQTKDIANGTSNHYMHLYWAKWVQNDTWTFNILDSLEGRGSLYYCAFEPRSESLVLCSNREIKFKSENEINTIGTEVLEKPQLHTEKNENSGFQWSQTDEDITIKFDVKEDKEKTDYNVKCTSDKLTVKCSEDTLLDKVLFSKVDQDLTTWTIENNFLQITLSKQISSLFWTSLLENGEGPKETLDNINSNPIPMEQQPIANLEAPIEDCDFPIGIMDDEIKIERFNLPTKSVTHSVLLGSTPPLFSTSLRPGFPLAIATRQDVDACLWLQQYNPSKPDVWALRHEGNLHAFGYVQASKQQKKFMDCSPDLNYAIITESHRHIFLYKSNYDSENSLRNRHGPQVQIGKQHLITLDNVGEVLGMATAATVVTFLTEKYLLYLQIN
ncbi:nudC domain-containing protein 1-like [Teleopsis dalmanni]|uniref:nudC domain-containing protein 1 n=1 Tax=Teleopsis dalmanni TaxID=139649 RepID=UPI0018CDD2E7|nr:nudC domain-containing protein 1 [Teleopsis dalmanni]XP_037939657.1 nudC domain-containing protein 1-like [Teleopsis dalmanni]